MAHDYKVSGSDRRRISSSMQAPKKYLMLTQNFRNEYPVRSSLRQEANEILKLIQEEMSNLEQELMKDKDKVPRERRKQ